MAKPLRVFRPVTSETSENLAVFRSAKRHFSKHEIRPRVWFQATIVAGHESAPRPDQTFTPLREALFPLPETGDKPAAFDIIGLAYLAKGKLMSERALVLLLDDPAGIIVSERAEYFSRMGRPLPDGSYKPHVSLFDLPAENATTAVQNWAESHAPKSIALQSLNTFPFVPRPRRESASGELVPPIVHGPAATVRRLQPAPIPQEMFDRMRGFTPTEK